MKVQDLTFDQLPGAVTILLNEVSQLKQMLADKAPQKPTPPADADLITIKEACDLLNVSRGTLWRYEQQGKIKVYGIGARRLLKQSEVLNSLTLKK